MVQLSPYEQRTDTPLGWMSIFSGNFLIFYYVMACGEHDDLKTTLQLAAPLKGGVLATDLLRSVAKLLFVKVHLSLTDTQIF